MSDRHLIRDLIYFDFDKAASIVSQIDGGLIQEYHDESGTSRDIGGELDVKLAKLGGTATDTTGKLVVKSAHHDLLVRVEEALFDKAVALDLSRELADTSLCVDELHSRISDSPYIRAEGFCWFNDYERIKRFINGVVDLSDFQTGIALQGVDRADEFFALQSEINGQLSALASNTDQNKKRSIKTKLAKLKAKKKSLENEYSLKRIDAGLPSWMVQGLEDLMDLFMPRRNAFILQPDEELDDFKVIANLKKECIVDSDWEHVIFAYGSEPNVRLTIFGLVTSIPQPTLKNVNPFENDPASQSADDITKLARVFTDAFASIAPFEQIGQITHYPSVTVYPIAVYHGIQVIDS